MNTRWKNVAGDMIVQVFNSALIDDECAGWATDDKVMPDSVQQELNKIPGSEKMEFVELTINFLSSGYSDSGRLSGPPEDCYPPESEDERTLDSVVITLEDGKTMILMGDSAAQEVFNTFEEDIMEVEVDATPDYGDYGDDNYPDDD